ncbi:hypothetical protein [Waddlia chondrophila]|uniref:Uncharacterized protein n=1 Tax=Waddlia chondrophila (strain ATCC VR-1470 / WSU 86-1044) TaxID=716544 RepID=D6YTQ9_WADCW|nr:hypothetical protein [Waddlia chondrophila]ADI37520.1 hypothetical protein wcw_0145 [Waddlia chondrophila WSU 86-1044]
MSIDGYRSSDTLAKIQQSTAAKDVKRTETKEESGKTMVSYDVKLQGRSFKVTVGFDKTQLEAHYKSQLDELPEGQKNVLTVVDKIVSGIKAEDLIAMSGTRISTSIADHADAQHTKVHLQGEKDPTCLSELDGKGKGELAKSITNVIQTFSKQEVRQLIQNAKESTSSLSPTHQVQIPTVSFQESSDPKVEEEKDDPLIFSVSVQRENPESLPSDEQSPAKRTESKVQAASTAAFRLPDENKTSDKPLMTGSTEDPGKKIFQRWSDKQGFVADETIERIDTVEKLQKNASQEIGYLKQKLSDCNPEEKTKIEARIDQLEKIRVKCQQKGASWANSDYFRDMLRGNSDLRSAENKEGIRGAIQEFSKVMDEEYYAKAPPVNMRYHKCDVRGKTEKEATSTGWIRVGVVSCMDNGFVNQSSMRELQNALKEGKEDLATEKRNEMTQGIFEVWKEQSKKGNSNIDASAGYALTQLGYSLEQVETIADIIKKGGDFSDIPGDVLKIGKENIAQVAEGVDAVMEKRNQLMANQFLQIVMEQLEHSSPEDLAGNQLRMLHVGLLNHQSRSVDGTGWYHNEDQEMQDMADIFDQFDQAKLICDGKGPYIDSDGNIHLPSMSQLPEGVQELSLRAIYLNQSVQGHTENDGTQRELNEKALKKLKGMGIDDETMKGLEQKLTGKKSGYTSAADTVNLGLKARFKVSTGCLSAKDRTGFVSALVTKRKMEEKRFPKSTVRRVMRGQLGTSSPAVRVIKDNTGTRIMKITPFKIEGLTKDEYSPTNFAARLIVYANQGIEIMKERKRIAKYEKLGKASAAA